MMASAPVVFGLCGLPAPPVGEFGLETIIDVGEWRFEATIDVAMGG